MRNHKNVQISTYTHLKPVDENDKLNWLRLCRTNAIGPITFFTLLERFESADEALKALPHLAKKGGNKNFNENYSLSDAEIEIENHLKIGADLIFFGDPEYPELLRHIPDPPPILSFLGDKKHLQKKMLSIIGARNASIYGKQFARKISAALGAHNYCIVSGFARGIDTAAHEAAAHTGTIAVFASGIDVVYPQENIELYEQLKSDGAILSETPFGTPPHATLFPRRNRIVAGMSLATVVIEAAQKSGSLITAQFAVDYGRDIFVSPGSPLDPRYHGSNNLIRNGATLIQSSDDILDELKPQNKSTLHESGSRHTFHHDSLSDALTSEKNRLSLMNNLSFEPICIDELIQECHLSSSEVLTYLLELEVAGKIVRVSTNQVALKEEPL